MTPWGRMSRKALLRRREIAALEEIGYELLLIREAMQKALRLALGEEDLSLFEQEEEPEAGD